MYVDPNDSRLQVYRKARQKARRRAIKRNQIQAQNPQIDRALMERIIDAQMKQEHAVK